MTIATTIADIKALPGMTGHYDSDTREYRVTIRSAALSERFPTLTPADRYEKAESIACYTNCPEDALDTAKAMSARWLNDLRPTADPLPPRDDEALTPRGLRIGLSRQPGETYDIFKARVESVEAAGRTINRADWSAEVARLTADRARMDAMKDFVAMVARLTSEQDMEDAGNDDGMSGDDACETVNILIREARALIA